MPENGGGDAVAELWREYKQRRTPEARERLVLSHHYYEGLTLSEIGDVLGVTESRVCQIHTKAVLQLRARLADSKSASGLTPPSSPRLFSLS